MQCPKCQHDMIESRNGWLCLNCGHLESDAHTKPLIPGEQPTTSVTPAISVSAAKNDLAGASKQEDQPMKTDDTTGADGKDHKDEPAQPIKVQIADDKTPVDKPVEALVETPEVVAEPVASEATNAPAEVSDAQSAPVKTDSVVESDTESEVQDGPVEVKEAELAEPEPRAAADVQAQDKPQEPVSGEPATSEPEVEPKSEPEAKVEDDAKEPEKLAKEDSVEDKPEASSNKDAAEDALAAVQAAVAEAEAATKASPVESPSSEPVSEPNLEPKEAASESAPEATAEQGEAPKAAPVHATDVHTNPSKPIDSLNTRPVEETAPSLSVTPATAETQIQVETPIAAPVESATSAAPAASVAETPVTSVPAVVPAGPAPSVEAAIASQLPKPPVVATTHPHPISSRDIALMIGGVVLLLGVGAWAFLTMTKTKVGTAPISTPAAVAQQSSAPSVLPAETEATPAADLAAVRDAHRKADLLAYAAAYRATIKKGYYATTPPTVSVQAIDPSTQQAYAIATAEPATLGAIEYQPGGRCDAPAMTPGKAATKYVALRIKLESEPTAYCLGL